MEYYLLLYFGSGFVCIALSILINRRHKVKSIFTEEIFLDPIAALLIILCWPLTCLLDLLGIVLRRKRKFDFLTKRLLEKREARKIKQSEKVEYRAVIGQKGVTVTPLGLSGKVNIAGKLWDAHSLNGYISPNENVVVRNRVGNELKVELDKEVL